MAIRLVVIERMVISTRAPSRVGRATHPDSSRLSGRTRMLNPDDLTRMMLLDTRQRFTQPEQHNRCDPSAMPSARMPNICVKGAPPAIAGASSRL